MAVLESRAGLTLKGFRSCIGFLDGDVAERLDGGQDSS
jgi:hypothetical protein